MLVIPSLDGLHMAVASSPAGPVLAAPVFTVTFGTAHAQIMDSTFGAALTTCCRRTCIRHTHFLVLRHSHSNSITDSTAQDDIPEKAHQQVN